MIPIISVIVPLHNEEKYIDRLMESIQSQTHRRLQIILVDGGSTDKTAEKCGKWASKWNMGPDSNMGIVEVIHTADNGVSASRNIGLGHATGTYVAFVDGDDYLKPDALSRMLKALEDADADMCGCGFESIYPEGAEAETLAGINPDGTSECMSSADYIDNGILSGDMHVWGKLYKRDLIDRQKFKEGLTIGEDMLFVTEYASKCSKVVRITYEGYNYFRNPHGAMGRPFTPSAMDQVRCYREERALLEKVAPDLAFGPKLRSNMLIGVMLTAGRIALLDKEVRKDDEHKEYVKLLRSTIREYKNHEAMKLLDRGYRAKVRLFKLFPGLYMSLYHRHKVQT